jgi:myo-inositol-1(or 4)-monophosphatase
VAAGFTDGFFETGLSIWDVAAGSLLVTEAGGLVGNFTGEADFLEQRECLAGNPRIYGQLVPILGKYSKFASAGDKAAVRQAAAAADTPETAEAETAAASDMDLDAPATTPQADAPKGQDAPF